MKGSKGLLKTTGASSVFSCKRLLGRYKFKSNILELGISMSESNDPTTANRCHNRKLNFNIIYLKERIVQ